MTSRLTIRMGAFLFLFVSGCTVAVDPLAKLPPASAGSGRPLVVVRSFTDRRDDPGSRQIGAIKNYILFNWKQFRYQASDSPGNLIAEAFARGLRDRGIHAVVNQGVAAFELHGEIDEFLSDVVMRYGVRVAGRAKLVSVRSQPPQVLATATFWEEKFRGPAMTTAWGSGAVMEDLFAEIIPKAVASVLDQPTFQAAFHGER